MIKHIKRTGLLHKGWIDFHWFKWSGILIHWLRYQLFIFSYFFKIFILGCVGSSFLCEGFLQLRQAGATLQRGTWASSLSRPLLLQSTGCRCAGSVIVAHGPSCSAACGILPDQGLNLCPPALAGRFSTTAPPGKPPTHFFLSQTFISLIFPDLEE